MGTIPTHLIPGFLRHRFGLLQETAPENVRTCGFKRNSSKLERAPKMRHSVLLNFLDNSLVTLSSIRSKICAIYSSMIPETDEFCD